MQKITSFTIDHLKLQPGIYVSRKDPVGNACVTTFDIRMTSPNEEPVMNTAEVHTIEHLGATFLRNHPDFGPKILYFGPMGCRTGFYLLLAGDYESRGYCIPDDGDVHLYPGLPGRSSRSLREGLRQLPGYESSHGKLSGRPFSFQRSGGHWPGPALLSSVKRIPSRSGMAPQRAGRCGFLSIRTRMLPPQTIPSAPASPEERSYLISAGNSRPLPASRMA